MLVHKKALVLKEILDATATSNIKHLYVDNEVAVATDGYILIEIQNPDQKLVENFPGNPPNTDKPVLLKRETIEKVEKNLPKSKDSHDILKHFVIGRDNEGIVITVDDLENIVTIRQKDLAVEYPDYKKAIPSDDKIKFKVRINKNILKQLLKVIEKIGDHEIGIWFEFTEDPEAPIRIRYESENTKLRGALMPMRQD